MFRFTSRLAVFTLLTTMLSTAHAAPPTVGEAATDFTLPALGGSTATTKLSDVNKQGPVVLVILRGFPGYQCPICTKQVGELRGKADELAAAKAQVILVYPGPAEGLLQHAQDFTPGKSLPKNFRMVLDPDFALVKKYDLRWDAPNETAYPSTFVIDRNGKIVFARVSKSHGGRATVAEILAALPK